MKKKRLDIRKLLWYIIIAFPILSYLSGSLILHISGVSTDTVPFATFLTDNFALSTSNFLLDMFNGIFATGGLMPIFEVNSGVLIYMVYFVGIELLHIILDVLLFLPNVLHCVFDKIGGTNEHDF